jgi:hypothetical protein
MKNLKIKIAVALFSVVALMSSCSKDEITKTGETEAVQARNGKETVATREKSSNGNGEMSRNGETYQIRHYIFYRNQSFLIVNHGHVGVGFEVRTYVGSTLKSTSFYMGGVENPTGQAFVAPGGFVDGWSYRTTTLTGMRNVMRTEGYTDYRQTNSYRPLSDAQYDDGYNTLVAFPTRGYSLWTNNCLDAFYQVATRSNCGNVPFIPINPVPSEYFSSMRVYTNWSSSIKV